MDARLKTYEKALAAREDNAARRLSLYENYRNKSVSKLISEWSRDAREKYSRQTEGSQRSSDARGSQEAT